MYSNGDLWRCLVTRSDDGRVQILFINGSMRCCTRPGFVLTSFPTFVGRVPCTVIDSVRTNRKQLAFMFPRVFNDVICRYYRVRLRLPGTVRFYYRPLSPPLLPCPTPIVRSALRSIQYDRTIHLTTHTHVHNNWNWADTCYAARPGLPYNGPFRFWSTLRWNSDGINRP